VRIPGYEVFVMPEKEHRAAVIFRGKDLSDKLQDTDPQHTGVPPLSVTPTAPEAKNAAMVVESFLKQARDLLEKEEKANTLLLRGFALPPVIPTMNELYKLKTAALATYPMYKGLAHLVGMEVIEGLTTRQEQAAKLKELYGQYTFFFVHYKKTDSTGEDGSFDAKVAATADFDKLVADVTALKPDVLVVTGDHSTPSYTASHSWHPVPFLLHARTARADRLRAFNEDTCRQGSFGVFRSRDALALALAHAQKLEKFGA